ncbi:MAG: hypothetical protein EA378_00265 [Phycisphaerales bacterium]|nr:MAG: hypothetical protein EA378_00265 [Phycisphaerales bacterium]
MSTGRPIDRTPEPGPSPGAGHPDTPSARQDKDARPMMTATRRPLESTREAVTHKFSVGGHEGYLTIGLYPDGTPGEIFIKIAKAGSALSGMCQAFCRAFSLAMQFGLTVDEACQRFKGMRFEPLGMTSNPDIPEAASIVDYVARYLEIHFGSRGGR